MADVTMHAEFDSLTVDDEFSSDVQGCIHTGTESSSEVQPEFSLTEDQPLFIELCAGSATLSSVVKARGFDVLPIDHEANRHKTKCKVFQMDLSEQHAIDTLVHITTHYPILAVHVGLPCGTCSKARGIPMSDGSEGPPPLRSQEFLLGLPDLSDTNLLKVRSANSLYQRAELLIEHLERLGITWTVENPTNSFLWDLPFLAFAMAHGKLHHCHACAFGGTRKKLTTFLSNNDAFQEMSRFCEDVPPHEHEPWGYDHQLKCFNTSKEAEYPVKMCEQYAAILQDLRPNCVQPQSSKRKLPFTQTGGRSNPQVISEFLTVVTLKLHSVPPINNKRQLMNGLYNVPAGSRLLRTEANKGGFTCVFGVYRSMQQFFECARQLWHPFDELKNLPDRLITSIFNNITSSPHELAKQRCKFMTHWTRRARDLQKDENQLHMSMPEHVRAVLKGKRILLMKELAQSIRWPDMSLFDEMTAGFKLVGTVAKTGIFKPHVTVANMSASDLEKKMKFLRPMILGKLRKFRDEKLQSELHRITMEEAAEKHWLQGPYAPEDIAGLVGDQWLPVRRFAVEQKGKVRPIDNLKESMLNLTFGAFEKIELRAMEHVLWCLVILSKCLRVGGEIVFSLSNGSELKGHVHKDWMERPPEVKATCIDLKSAYKQLALHPDEYRRTVVSLWNVDANKPSCFLMRTLPFGASASVHHFLRISYFIHAVGLEAGLCWGAYFDDFPTLTHVYNEASTRATALGILDLMGFKCSLDKLEEFSPQAEMLGVELNLKSFHEGKIIVKNKGSRVSEMIECIDKIFENGFIESDNIPSALGKMQYAEAQLWGRAGRIALSDLREATLHRDAKIPLVPEVEQALRVLKEKFKNGKPRTLVASETRKPHIVFVDGSLEYDISGKAVACIGGVVCARNGAREVFGCDVPGDIIEGWQSEGKTHVIGLIELYALVTALNTWKSFLGNDRVILFTDSWPVYDVVVRGTSSERSWRRLLLNLEEFDERCPMLLWIARVPSSSNPADPPSRRSLKELDFLRPFKVVDALCPIHQCAVKSYEM